MSHPEKFLHWIDSKEVRKGAVGKVCCVDRQCIFSNVIYSCSALLTFWKIKIKILFSVVWVISAVSAAVPNHTKGSYERSPKGIQGWRNFLIVWDLIVITLSLMLCEGAEVTGLFILSKWQIFIVVLWTQKEKKKGGYLVSKPCPEKWKLWIKTGKRMLVLPKI